MSGTAKPLQLKQPLLISALIAEIARQSPQSNVNQAQFAAIVEAANHVVSVFSHEHAGEQQ